MFGSDGYRTFFRVETDPLIVCSGLRLEARAGSNNPFLILNFKV